MAIVNDELYQLRNWPRKRIERFLAFVKVLDVDACWLWLGSRTGTGHGRYRYREAGKMKSVLAHRVMWTLERGPVKRGFETMHACKQLLCCNPWGVKHVVVGRAKRRIALLRKHGRNIAGSRHPLAQLTEVEVRRLLELKRLKPELTGRQLAEVVGLKSGAWANAIVRGAGWKTLKVARLSKRRGK